MAVHGMSLDESEISKQRFTGGVEPWYVSHSDTPPEIVVLPVLLLVLKVQ
jgi:hypothetical protein